jgi:hypothetical protein
MTIRSSSEIAVGAFLDPIEALLHVVDQRAHALRLRCEIAGDELLRVARRAVRIEAVLRLERIERCVERRARRIGLACDRHQRAHHHHRLARMRVGEDDAVGTRETGEIRRAGIEALAVLAVGRAVLGDRLVEAHRRPAARMAEQHDLGDARLPPQEFHPGLHVERDLVPAHLHFVVGVARVHAQHHEAAFGKLGAARVRQIIRGAVDDDQPDMRRRSAVGLVERGRCRREADEQRIALRECRRKARQQQRACAQHAENQRHRPLPVFVLPRRLAPGGRRRKRGRRNAHPHKTKERREAPLLKTWN